MKARIDIHEYDKRLACAIRRIKAAKKISKTNKADMMEFQKYLYAKGLTAGRIAKYLNHLCKVSHLLGKDFRKTNKNDMIELVRGIESQPYSLWTKHDFRVVLKRFFQWLRKCDEDEKEYPPEVKWMKTTMKNGNHKLPEELWTEEEVKRLIDAADHPRDKALIFMLYESGCRVGEMASLRIRHVRFDEYGGIITVSGKTGMRRIRLVSSVPSLSAWLSNHPDKNSPESPLWVSIGTKNKGKIINYKSISDILKKNARKAGIRKKANPHMFRHSRATFLANCLTESQLKEMFGWTQGSNMAAVYVHLSGRDTDDAILRLNGIATGKEEKKESKLKPVKCPRCEFMNGATSNFCNRCAAPLNIESATRIEERSNELTQSFAEAIGNGANGLAKVVKKPESISREDIERLARLLMPYMKGFT
ncbi:MAG: tyrosine-type recombinase/integrase [Candidatus Aenigmatarchaeota archaeon]